MKRMLAIATLVVLTGCAAVPAPAERLAAVSRSATVAGLQPQQLRVGVLPLQGFLRLGCPGQALHVYIEGDGYAWVSSTLPSSDPTPLNPVALSLATLDPACNVAYLGRPGQYQSGQVESRYWLEARFAPEVVATYVAVIDDLAQKIAAPVVHLAGYSGGGAVATLAAARLSRNNSRGLSLRTVAGNLDTAAWTKLRKLSPLTESLNPAEAAVMLQSVPQLHIVGSRDRQVPPRVLDAFLARMDRLDCVQVHKVEASHAGPWEPAWRAAQARMPACGNAASATGEPKGTAGLVRP